MYDKRRALLEFGFFFTDLRKNIEKVVEVKPDTDVYGIVQVVIVVVMANK
jgi:hypothetical protein